MVPSVVSQVKVSSLVDVDSVTWFCFEISSVVAVFVFVGGLIDDDDDDDSV